MRNSAFRKNGQVFGFVPQSLSTVGAAAAWEKEQLRSAEVQSRSLLVPLWRALYVQLSFPPLFHHISPSTAFLLNHQANFWTVVAYKFTSEQENLPHQDAPADRQTRIIWIKTDLFL